MLDLKSTDWQSKRQKILLGKILSNDSKNLEDEREDTFNRFTDDTKLGGTDDTLQGRTVIWRNLDRCEEQGDSNIMKFSNV